MVQVKLKSYSEVESNYDLGKFCVYPSLSYRLFKTTEKLKIKSLIASLNNFVEW